MFEHVEAFAGDPILALNEAFQLDPRPNKVNLSIGVYFDESAKLPSLDSIHEAETRLLAAHKPKPYLPIEGDKAFRQAVQALLFGPDHEAVTSGRIATIQTVGSSSGLRTGGEFIKTWLKAPGVWVSDPTWENHRAMFESAGFAVETYPYYDPKGGVRFAAMLAKLKTLAPGSVVLLHACCHNPTGVDLSQAQWLELIPLLREKQLVPFLDLAYQGFGDGIDGDAFAVRAMVDAGLSFFAANSFSKSMSLYGERCGALSVICPNAEQAQRVLGQLKFTVRRNYSSPPAHGGQIAALVLNEPALRASWERDLDGMRVRILEMRKALHQSLSAKLPGRDFGYLLNQRGMFSYTGLSATQADELRERYGVYILRSGRVCIACLNAGNVEAVANAFAAVIAGHAV